MNISKKTKTAAGALFLLLLIVGTVWILSDAHSAEYRRIEGRIFGTYYHIIYQSSLDLNTEILGEMDEVDNTFSAFNQGSLVSRINRNEPAETTRMFNHVFDLAESISRATNGAFDITVGPLVNLWGFGKDTGRTYADSAPPRRLIDSIMPIVGYRKVQLRKNRILKQTPATRLDFSAIAKGYGCDAVAGVLVRHGVENYMVEIGGEIRAHGVNDQGNVWTVGIVLPIDETARNAGAQTPAPDSLPPTPAANSANRLEATLQMPSVAMATSGNYRNFYYKGGKKYAHTIDPHTGYPVQHSLLSATVIAPTCAEADGYATAFMVMGMEKAVALLRQTPRLKAHLIYADSHGRIQSWTSPKLERYLDTTP